jgi:hypothetical protein
MLNSGSWLLRPLPTRDEPAVPKTALSESMLDLAPPAPASEDDNPSGACGTAREHTRIQGYKAARDIREAEAEDTERWEVVVLEEEEMERGSESVSTAREKSRGVKKPSGQQWHRLEQHRPARPLHSFLVLARGACRVTWHVGQAKQS